MSEKLNTLTWSQPRDYILTGILKCSECHAGFRGASAHGKLNVHRYYEHKTGENKITCQVKRIKAGEIENIVLKNLGLSAYKIGHFEVAQMNIDELMKKQKVDMLQDEQRIKERLLQIDHEMNHAFKLRDADSSQISVINVILGHIEKLKFERESLTETLSIIHEKLESMVELNIDWQNPGDVLRKFNIGWELLAPFQRKRLLAKTFKEISVAKDGFVAVCWPQLKKEVTPESEEI